MNNPTTLVIGNSGKTGRRVEQQLKAMGVATRGVSRSTEIPFDWYDQSTWAAALEGTESAYVAFQPDLAIPGADDIIQAFCDLSKSQGLHKIVMLSGRGEEGAQKAEQALINSDLSWNIVRASWFAQNFSEGFMIDGILSGEMVLPESSTLEPFIDVDDIADVAVAALTNEKLANRLFEVTGPELMTFADCIAAINQATGKNIALKPVSVSDYVQQLAALGVPKDVQWLMNELFSVVFDGRNASIANGVREATGREPTRFADYIQKVIAAGTWDTGAASNLG